MTDIDQTHIRRLDFTLLLVFQALLRARRTTEVAAQLGLSQSAISHALGRLRQVFGDALFVRRPHGLEPTQHALELGPRIDAILDDVRGALGLAGAFDPAVSDRGFRLAAPDFLATLLAAPLRAAFAADAPHVRFALRIQLGREALRSLDRGDIDVAVGRFPASLDGLQVTPLWDDRYVLVARNDHPALATPLTRAGFERLEHAVVSVTGDFRAITDQDFRDLGVRRRVVATVPRFTIALDLVSRTDTVAIAPERLARAYAERFGLGVRELPFRLPRLGLVAVSRLAPDPGVRWLVERLSRLAPESGSVKPKRGLSG